MDNLLKTQIRTAPGSVGDTAKAYAKSYSSINKTCTKDLTKFTDAFRAVVAMRLMAYASLGVDDGNLLSPPVTENTFQPIYRFFDDFEEKHGGSYAFESLGNRNHFKIDLPTMILYTMLLESNNKREGFFAFGIMDSSFINEVLRIVYQETNNVCSYQTFFPESNFIVENNHKLLLFLCDVSMMNQRR